MLWVLKKTTVTPDQTTPLEGFILFASNYESSLKCILIYAIRAIDKDRFIVFQLFLQKNELKFKNHRIKTN